MIQAVLMLLSVVWAVLGLAWYLLEPPFKTAWGTWLGVFVAGPGVWIVLGVLVLVPWMLGYHDQGRRDG